jgi:hypothetical protein
VDGHLENAVLALEFDRLEFLRVIVVLRCHFTAPFLPSSPRRRGSRRRH